MGLFSGLFRARDAPQNRTSGSAYSFFMGGSIQQLMYPVSFLCLRRLFRRRGTFLFKPVIVHCHPVRYEELKEILLIHPSTSFDRRIRRSPQRRLTVLWPPSWGLTGQSAVGEELKEILLIHPSTSFDRHHKRIL